MPSWKNRLPSEAVEERKKLWKQMKGKGKGSASSSSGGIGSTIASGARAVGGAVLDGARQALVEGAKNAFLGAL